MQRMPVRARHAAAGSSGPTARQAVVGAVRGGAAAGVLRWIMIAARTAMVVFAAMTVAIVRVFVIAAVVVRPGRTAPR